MLTKTSSKRPKDRNAKYLSFCSKATRATFVAMPCSHGSRIEHLSFRPLDARNPFTCSVVGGEEPFAKLFGCDFSGFPGGRMLVKDPAHRSCCLVAATYSTLEGVSCSFFLRVS